MAEYELAQVNVGRLRAPVGAPEIAGFVSNLDRINAMADGHPGFVWRLKGEGNNATDVAAFDEPLMAINLSTWANLEDLAAFVYRTDHREIMRRRAEWFERMEVYMCLWWAPAGHRPTPREAVERLDTFRRSGPSPQAFSFREPYPAPDAFTAPPPILDRCA